MYGVLYGGVGLYDNVLDCLSFLRKNGKKVIVLSNTSATSDSAKNSYRKFGLNENVHYDHFITAGEIFHQFLNKNFANDVPKYHQIFVPNSSIFKNTSLVEVGKISKADFVYVGLVYINGQPIDLSKVIDADNNPINIDKLFDYDWKLLKSLNIIQKILEECKQYEKKIFIANPDILAMEQNNGVVSPIICQGGVAEYYERIGGEVAYFGKPYQTIYDYAKQFIQGKTVMVGDTPWTDILGGNMAQIDTILTLTGVSQLFLSKVSTKDSLEERLSELLINISNKMTHSSLKNISRTPTYVIERFC
jgi:HAD superfamily hydrolase (TIGR01450 family)